MIQKQVTENHGSKGHGWKNYIRMAALLVLTALCLSGCGGGKLSEDFDETAVKEAAQRATDCLVAGEYEDCVAMMSQELQAALTPETLSANVEAMNQQTGDFREYKSVAVVGQKDTDGKECAVAVVVGSFEKCNVTYNVSFNTEMEIIGLWMK